MKRNGLIKLKFDKQPDGTHYREGHISWVPEGEAEQYMEDGLATEYEPEPEPEPELEPTIDLDDDLPARHHFIDEEIYLMEDVEQLAKDGELQSVEGIGDSTENKIQNYLDNGNA